MTVGPLPLLERLLLRSLLLLLLLTRRCELPLQCCEIFEISAVSPAAAVAAGFPAVVLAIAALSVAVIAAAAVATFGAAFATRTAAPEEGE